MACSIRPTPLGAAAAVLAAAVTLLVRSDAVAALEFDLHDPVRCFEEEIHEEVMVVGEYAVFAFREHIAGVLRQMNATTSDRDHFGFLKQMDLDELVSRLEPDKNITNASAKEQEEQVVAYFQSREENYLRLHEDNPDAVRDFQEQARAVVHKYTIPEMFLGLVHQRVHLPLRLTVTDPAGQVVIARTADTEATFTFDAKKSGIFRCCVEVLDDLLRGPGWPLADNRGRKITMSDLVRFLDTAKKPMKVKMNWKVGIQTAEWETRARSNNLQVIAEKLTAIDKEMRDTENEMQRIMGLNRELLETAEAHEKLIGLLGIVAMAVVACLSFGQIFFLKIFFKKRKLI